TSRKRIQSVSENGTLRPVAVRTVADHALSGVSRHSTLRLIAEWSYKCRNAWGCSVDPRRISFVLASDDAYIGHSSPVLAHVARRHNARALYPTCAIT